MMGLDKVLYRQISTKEKNPKSDLIKMHLHDDKISLQLFEMCT